VKFDAEAGLDVGERGQFVKEQGEAGALPQVSGGGPAADEGPSLVEELGREAGAVER